MSMKSIFLVNRIDDVSHGKGHDDSVRTVTAYLDRDVAELHVKKANEFVTTWTAEYVSGSPFTLPRCNPWDNDPNTVAWLIAHPYGQSGYYSTRYEVQEVSVFLHPDQYLDAHHLPVEVM